MRPRLAALKRLVNLYKVVEEMHSVELQRTTAAVREVDQAIGVQHEVTRSSRFHSRDALVVGDRMGWTMAEMLRESAGRKRRRLDEIRLEREGLSDAAKDQYVASRLKNEQMKRVVDRVAERIEIEHERRMQAVSDDSFLAQRRWTDTRGERRADMSMKGS